jgi:serine protease Do
MTMRLFLAAALALMLPLAAHAAGPAAAAEEPLPDLVARLLPQVVNISFQHVEAKPGLAPVPVKRGVGTGFVVDPRGIIATNRHVTDGGEEIYATLSDNTRLRATLIYRSPDIDLALLQVSPKEPLAAVTFGDSDAIRQGDSVLAIGNPLGLGGTVTSGIISALDRDIRETALDSFMQIDVAINPGNSGGPLFNRKGEVVGVNTAVYGLPGGGASGSIGLNFAIPANDVQFIMDNLRLYGRMRRGLIGAALQDVSPDLANSLGLPRAEGALIATIVPGGPADKAGLRVGDVLLSLVGKPIVNLRAAIRFITASPGRADTVVRIRRNDRDMEVNVVLGEATNPDEAVSMVMPAGAMQAVSEAALGVMTAKDGGPGLVLTSVSPDGLGAYLGLGQGTRVLRLQSGPIDTLQDIIRAAGVTYDKGRTHLAVLVTDDKGDRWVAMPLVIPAK